MDIKEIRRSNLNRLRKLFDTKAEMAQELSMDPSQVWQYLADPDEAKSARPVGDRVARRIEKSLGLPYGSMDSPLLVDEAFTLEQLRNRIAEPGGSNYVIGVGDEIDPRTMGKVPLISKVKAGEAEFSVDHLEPGDAEEWLYCNTPHSPSTYALVVDGDSMERPYGKQYPDGCIVFVDPEKRGGVGNGDPIIAKINGVDAVTFKILAEADGRKFLKPLNQQHPVNMKEFRVLGKVIEKLERE